MNPPDLRICFIGDSYVQGIGDDECLGWAGRLCALARRTGNNLTYYNLGVRRETSTDILHRWQLECAPRLLPSTENYVVFSFGANDVSLVNGQRRVSEGQTLENLRTVLGTARTHYRTLMVGPPPAADADHNQRLAALSLHMDSAATELGVPYITILPALLDDPIWCQEVRDHDGAHPRTAGYARLAEIVLASRHWWFGNR